MGLPCRALCSHYNLFIPEIHRRTRRTRNHAPRCSSERRGKETRKGRGTEEDAVRKRSVAVDAGAKGDGTGASESDAVVSVRMGRSGEVYGC